MNLFLMCVATVGLVAVTASSIVGLLCIALRKQLGQLAPAAQARLLLAGSIFPLTAALLVLGAALAPSFGWIADHYSGELHSHPHLCSAHPIVGWPSIPLVALALLVAARVVQTVLTSGHAAMLSWTTAGSMKQASHADIQRGLRIIPSDEPQAFVLGLLRPTIFATRGLVSGAARKHLPAVLAHEQAHLQRYDPLRRFCANLGNSLHIPSVARILDSAHERALEMAADEQAAERVGSRADVATALVALAKARTQVPRAAFSVLGSATHSDLETRVVKLMEGGTYRDWPKRSTLFLAATAIAVAVAIGADTVHHKVEFLLGAFGS